MEGRRICPHCNEYVSLKTYKAHRRLHYDAITDRWSRRESSVSEEEEDTLEDSPPQSIGLVLSHDLTVDDDHSFVGTMTLQIS